MKKGWYNSVTWTNSSHGLLEISGTHLSFQVGKANVQLTFNEWTTNTVEPRREACVRYRLACAVSNLFGKASLPGLDSSLRYGIHRDTSLAEHTESHCLSSVSHFRHSYIMIHRLSRNSTQRIQVYSIVHTNVYARSQSVTTRRRDPVAGQGRAFPERI